MSKKAKLGVQILVPSDHTMVIPKGMQGLAEELFSEAGLTGDFTLYLGKRERGSAHLKGITVRSEPVGRVIKFRAQPGGNETNHTLNFTVPDGLSVPQVFNAFRGVADHRVASIQRVRTEKKMRRLYRFVQGSAFSLGDLEDVFDELGFNSLVSLGQALAGFAREKIFVFQEQKEDKFSWTGEFHQTMKEIGYDLADLEARDSMPEPDEAEDEEDEEGRIIARVYEIDNRLEDIAKLITTSDEECRVIEKKLGEAQREFDILLAQVEKANAHLGDLRGCENNLILEISELQDEKVALHQEKSDLENRVEELDREKKLARAADRARSALAELTPEERTMLISRLQSATGGM